jgi:hypothetical protein
MIAYLRRKAYEWTDARFDRPGVMQILYQDVRIRDGGVYVGGVNILDEVGAMYFRAVGVEYGLVNAIINLAGDIPIADSYLRNGAGPRSKALMIDAFSELGIPHPESRLYIGIDGLKDANLEFPRIAKVSRGGRGGKGTFLLSEPGDIDRIPDILRDREDAFRYNLGECEWIVQEYVPNVGDYRAMVVGEECIGITKRRPKDGLFVLDTSSGKSRRFKNGRWPRDIGDMAVRAAQAMGVDIAGVDLVRGPNGPVVIEVNEAPAFKVFEKRTGIDVAGVVIDYMEALT